MGDIERTHALVGPPADFVAQVRDALEHLYDYGHLQTHPLASAVLPATRASTTTTGRQLADKLIEAVQSLRPSPDTRATTPDARLYTLLQSHYVEREKVQCAARHVGVSKRQAYRDLRRGQQSIASILWATCGSWPGRPHDAAALSSLREEIDRIRTGPELLDLRELLSQATEAVRYLAEQRGVHLDVQKPPRPVPAMLERMLARQALTELLSRAVRLSAAAPLQIRLAPAVGTMPDITVEYHRGTSTGDSTAADAVLAQIVDVLGWALRETTLPTGSHEVAVRITWDQPTLLVVDDSEGLTYLVRRYLADQACHVIAATAGLEGLRMAQEEAPDAILLDVMMPDMDGWEFLLRLRTLPQTAKIPVVVCSVVNDPELAHSLGASAFLAKPVDRDGFLETLRRLDVLQA